MRAGLLMLCAGALAVPAAAQQAAREIVVTERRALDADARAIALRRTADSADMKAQQARFTAITLARRIQQGEARAGRIEDRIRGLESQARQQRARLADKQSEASRLLAALQTLSRRPAGFVLLEPRAAVTTARVSALLDAVRPTLAARTATLRAQLTATRRLQAGLIAANRQLKTAETTLAANIRLLDALQTSQRAVRDRLDAEADAEREQARRLAGRAIDLRELARAVEINADRQRRRPQRAGSKPEVQLSGFDYRLPVTGSVQLGFGRSGDTGVRARGLTLATRGNAQVTAPANGRIAYAGPFRDYGDIVIIEHDAVMLSLISGMERVDVVVGESVRAGAPIGRMGSVGPELYLELRRTGRPVDPARYVARPG